MKQKGLRQIDLARAVGVSKSAVCYWVRGSKLPDIEHGKVLARLLEWTLDDLYG